MADPIDPKDPQKPAPDPDPNGKTSADVGAGGKTAKEIALEKKVATLEDEQHTIKGQLKEATDWIQKQIEGPAKKDESLADEVRHFLGCGLD